MDTGSPVSPPSGLPAISPTRGEIGRTDAPCLPSPVGNAPAAARVCRSLY